MADNRKYYYLKLKEDFFDSDELKILESQKDGYLYSNILLKLYLKSLSNAGRLMFRNVIPYTPEVLATLTGHQVGTVEKALDVFKRLGLIEVLDNGAIYMMDIQNFIGQSSSEADRQREYYNRMKPVILTTNMTLKEMQESEDIRYRRIYDRIFEMCFPVRFAGRSWREKAASKRFDAMKNLMEE